MRVKPVSARTSRKFLDQHHLLDDMGIAIGDTDGRQPQNRRHVGATCGMAEHLPFRLF